MPNLIVEYAINCSRYVRQFETATGATISKGDIVALNPQTGKAHPAADTANFVVVGIAENSTQAGETVFVLTGCFAIANDTTNAVSSAHVNKKVYVKSATTADSNGGTNKIVAGVCRFIDAQTGKVAIEIGNYFS